MLAGAYVVAPLFALAIGGGLSELEASDTLAVAAASTMFLAPMAVHLLHDQGDRALLALASLLGITFAGTIAGGGLGYLENEIDCDPDQNSECADRAIGTTIVGAALGSMVGYVTSAVLDVSLRSSAPEAPSNSASLRLWLVPARAESGSNTPSVQLRAAAPNPLGVDGLLMGMTLRL